MSVHLWCQHSDILQFTLDYIAVKNDRELNLLLHAPKEFKDYIFIKQNIFFAESTPDVVLITYNLISNYVVTRKKTMNSMKLILR